MIHSLTEERMSHSWASRIFQGVAFSGTLLIISAAITLTAIAWGSHFEMVNQEFKYNPILRLKIGTALVLGTLATARAIKGAAACTNIWKEKAHILWTDTRNGAFWPFLILGARF